MLRLLAPLFGTLICCSAAALAAAPQRECPVEDFDFAQRLEAVRSAPSCEVAVELFGLCGSAAGSVDMGEVVVAKCEGEFVSRLSKGRLSEYRRAQSRARKHGAEEPRTSKVNSYVCFDTDNHHYCGGCSCGGGRDEARGPTRSHACTLAVLTIGLGLPIWRTCDHYLLKILPTVWWFDPREPFAPYFLLYLPLSMLLAVTPAAALLAMLRLGASKIAALPCDPGADDVARRLALHGPTSVRNPQRHIRALQLWAERFRSWLKVNRLPALLSKNRPKTPPAVPQRRDPARAVDGEPVGALDGHAWIKPDIPATA